VGCDVMWRTCKWVWYAGGANTPTSLVYGRLCEITKAIISFYTDFLLAAQFMILYGWILK